MTSQNPSPCPAAERNLSRLIYFPRNTPSISNPPTLIFVMLCSARSDSTAFKSIVRTSFGCCPWSVALRQNELSEKCPTTDKERWTNPLYSGISSRDLRERGFSHRGHGDYARRPQRSLGDFSVRSVTQCPDRPCDSTLRGLCVKHPHIRHGPTSSWIIRAKDVFKLQSRRI